MNIAITDSALDIDQSTPTGEALRGRAALAFFRVANRVIADSGGVPGRLIALVDADRVAGGSRGRHPASRPGGNVKRGLSAPRVIAELYVMAMLVLLVGLLGISAAATGVFH